MSAIARIQHVIGRISDYQTTIASAVEEQTATTNEMSRSVAATTSRGVEDSRRAADELAGMSAELGLLVGRTT